MSVKFTVGNPQTLFVPVGIVDHEVDGEDGLQEDEREYGHHREGGHHRVGLLQIATGNIGGDQGERILLLPLLLLLDIWAVSLMVSDLVRK